MCARATHENVTERLFLKRPVARYAHGDSSRGGNNGRVVCYLAELGHRWLLERAVNDCVGEKSERPCRVCFASEPMRLTKRVVVAHKGKADDRDGSNQVAHVHDGELVMGTLSVTEQIDRYDNWMRC